MFPGLLITVILSFNSTHCATDLIKNLHGPIEKTPFEIKKPSGPPFSVGDTFSFWAFDLTSMPPEQIQVPATCRGVGEHCYVFVDDEEWGVHMDSSDVAEVIYRFDRATLADSTRGIFEMDSTYFGAPPNLDGDPRIVIFYYDMGSFAGNVFDGYFDPLNELPDSIAFPVYGYHSNEMEMFYMSCYPGQPASHSRLSVLSHEFEHMIHWNHDQDEESWVDEGCAEYAMVLYGLPDPITGFYNNPDNDLTSWNNQWDDYIKTMLFFTYLSEHYGGPSTLTAVVADTLNGIAGIDDVLENLGLGVTFRDVFRNWVTANFLDDDSLYGYTTFNLPPFHLSGDHTSYPVGPVNTSVNHWAADYISFSNGTDTLTITFDGSENALFGARVLLLGAETTVVDIPLDSLQNGEGDFPGFGIDFDRAVLIAMGLSSEGGTSYRYSASAMTDVEELPSAPLPARLYGGASPYLVIQLEKPAKLDMGIFDVTGRTICRKSFGTRGPGRVKLNIGPLPKRSGIYFVRLKAGGREVSFRLLRL